MIRVSIIGERGDLAFFDAKEAVSQAVCFGHTVGDVQYGYARVLLNRTQ